MRPCMDRVQNSLHTFGAGGGHSHQSFGSKKRGRPLAEVCRELLCEFWRVLQNPGLFGDCTENPGLLAKALVRVPPTRTKAQ